MIETEETRANAEIDTRVGVFIDSDMTDRQDLKFRYTCSGWNGAG